MTGETALVRALRAGFRWWPFMHGRGWILRLSRLLLDDSVVRVDIGSGTYVEGALDDWMILWTFMRLHERDAPFQRSFDLLPPGGVAVDVGANLGIWSLLAARRARAARVHAFEPSPAMIERLARHARMNGAGAIVVHQSAIGAENGSIVFFSARGGNSGASALVRRRADDVEMRVPVVTLDTCIEQERIDRVDLLKVDVEGGEALVFRGAPRLLSGERAPAVFFEADDELCAGFGTTTRDVKQLLVDHGYEIYRWRARTFSRVPVAEPHRHEDLFALKPRHVARIEPS